MSTRAVSKEAFWNNLRPPSLSQLPLFSCPQTYCSALGRRRLRLMQGPSSTQVMRLQPQRLVICRIWVNCSYNVVLDGEEDGNIIKT